MTAALDLLSLAFSSPRRRRRRLDPQRAVGYLRASTNRQELSPKAQLADIAGWSQRTGVEVVKVFQDQGVCGAAELEDRPGLADAIASLTTLGAGVLVISKRDRLGRDRILVGLVERAVERLGGKLIAVDQPGSLLHAAVTDVFSEHERLQIGVRTKDALGAKRAMGERVGGVPWGKRLDKDGVHLRDAPKEQVIIAMARRLHRRGRSLRQVGAALAKAGHKTRTGGRWWPETVRSLLRAGT
jgi:DNA invertase Pin-like site-specific DNA recombinase